jgi:ArsR family transcriptional regulator, lead/cadmium/zinc/bismuth-responsive transcriptional repressor
MANAVLTYSAVEEDTQSDVLSVDDAQSVARFFQVLSDPTRVRMVKMLAQGKWCVSDMTRALGMDQPAVSHQLKYLRDMGLVHWTKSGRHVYYTLSDKHLRDILLSSIRHLDALE